MWKNLLHRLKGLWNSLAKLLGLRKIAVYSEEKELTVQIKQAQAKLEHAWANLDNADPQYLDLAIWEIHICETQYCLLNNKYRMLHGDNEGQHSPAINLNPRKSYPWVNKQEPN